ncbi:unnamed protein product, partial [Symbiodinium necroappetens]
DIKPKAKAACKQPAEPKAKAKSQKKPHGKSVSKEDLQVRQKDNDAKKQERIDAAQAVANETCKIVRASGIEDVQPPLGFTAKWQVLSGVPTGFRLHYFVGGECGQERRFDYGMEEVRRWSLAKFLAGWTELDIDEAWLRESVSTRMRCAMCQFLLDEQGHTQEDERVSYGKGGVYWFLEQPSLSAMEFFPYLQYAMRLKTLNCEFMGTNMVRWMGLYNHWCFKPSIGFGSACEEMQMILVKRSIDKDGKKKVTGTKHGLEKSGAYPINFGLRVAELHLGLVAGRHDSNINDSLSLYSMHDKLIAGELRVTWLLQPIHVQNSRTSLMIINVETLGSGIGV